MHNELVAYLSYKRSDMPLTFWRSTNGQEVDFLIGNAVAIEAKATERVTPRDFGGLRALMDEGVFTRYFLVSQDPLRRSVDGVECVPWRTFLSELWTDAIVNSG